jgi:hypothetical protein
LALGTSDGVFVHQIVRHQILADAGVECARHGSQGVVVEITPPVKSFERNVTFAHRAM